MSGPEYLICMNCDSPCYVFEWKKGEVLEAVCEMCGNDDPEQFVTDEELDAYAE